MENAKKFYESFEEMKNYVLKMEAKKIKEEEAEIISEKSDKQEKMNPSMNSNNILDKLHDALSEQMADLGVNES